MLGLQVEKLLKGLRLQSNNLLCNISMQSGPASGSQNGRNAAHNSIAEYPRFVCPTLPVLRQRLTHTPALACLPTYIGTSARHLAIYFEAQTLFAVQDMGFLTSAR